MTRRAAAIGSALFFVLAPGVVAGLVPWLLTEWRSERSFSWWPAAAVLGGLLIVSGAVILLHAFARFVVEGHGTPAPVAPTARLVVGGLYRYVRNPMYLAVLAIIVGQALALGSIVLFGYAAIVATAFVLFVKVYEEPTLLATYGADYDEYRRQVPGWLPSLRGPRRRP